MKTQRKNPSGIWRRPSKVADIFLVQSTAKGDLKAWKELVHRYTDVIFDRAISVLQETELAERVVHQTFRRILVAAADIEIGTCIRQWIHGIIDRVILKVRRQSRLMRAVA